VCAFHHCDVCGLAHVFTSHDKKRHLCRSHFISDIESRVFEEFSRLSVAGYKKVVIAFSGGKDSSALLELFARYQKINPLFSITALTIDEGILGYRDACIDAAVTLANKHALEHTILSFSNLFSMTLDEAVKNNRGRACAVCGPMRRKALEKGANLMGADCVATGHCLDDEAQSILMNILRGDGKKLMRNPEKKREDLIPRVKPLRLLHEREVTLYTMLTDSYSMLPPCPYADSAVRNEVRSLLNSLEYKHPGSLMRLIRFQESLWSGRFKN